MELWHYAESKLAIHYLENSIKYGLVAQLVAQETLNLLVVGSSPTKPNFLYFTKFLKWNSLATIKDCWVLPSHKMTHLVSFCSAESPSPLSFSKEKESKKIFLILNQFMLKQNRLMSFSIILKFFKLYYVLETIGDCRVLFSPKMLLSFKI